jgi:hypothetical protein
MTSLSLRFSALAAHVYIPTDLLIVDKGYPIQFICYEMEESGPRVMLAVARITLPHSLSPAFSLADMYLVNQHLLNYAIYVNLTPLISGTMKCYNAINVLASYQINLGT